MLSHRYTNGGLLQRRLSGRLTKPGSRRGVVMLGGWTSSVDYWAEDMTATVEGRLIAEGITDYKRGLLTASVATDSTWGNQAIQDDVTELVDKCQDDGYFAAGRVHLHGSSMGGLTAFNWAYNNPSRVASISCVLPVIDVQSIWDRDPIEFMKASISAAHGGGRPPDDMNPASHNDAYLSIPTRIYYSTTDTVTPVDETLAFGEAIGAEMVSMGAVGHTFGEDIYTGAAVAAYIDRIEYD